MILYDIPDIRLFWSRDDGFLNQFKYDDPTFSKVVKYKVRIEFVKLNIKNKYNMSYGDFCNNKLRYIRGSNDLKNIDSVYRNRM